MNRRLFVLLVGPALIVGATTANASANNLGAPKPPVFGGSHDQGKVEVGAERGDVSSGRGSGGGPAPVTTISVTCGSGGEAQLAGLGDSAPPLTKETCADQTVACTTQGTAQKRKLDPVVTVEKQANGTWQYSGNQCVGAGPVGVTPELVRQQVVRLIPPSAVGVAPKGTTLVNIETVLWADAPRQRDLPPVTLLGQRVTVSIVLDHVAWKFGDGTTESGPAGKPYDGKRDPCREKSCKHYFGHVYRKTGSVTVSATATWHASFSVAGGAPVDIPGTVAGPTGTAGVVVKQTRAVLVPNPGEQP